MQIGQARVDFDSHFIDGPSGEVSVEPKVMEVLAVLVEQAGQVVTREALIDQVWGVGHGGDERLSRAIYLLRKALGDSRGKHAYIQTISGRGYKLTAGINAAVSESISISEGNQDTTQPVVQGLDQTKLNRKGLIATVSTALVALLAFITFGLDRSAPTTPEPPLVMVMDSTHPARVYDEDVLKNGGTNADILSDILADLPVRVQKELISPNWHRYEAILQFEPDLIVIHYSGFKQEDSRGDRPQLRLLLEYFLKTNTEFLVYSRASEEWLENAMGTVFEQTYKDNPEIKNRINIFPLLEYGEPYWQDPASAQGIKLRVKEVLELE